MQQSQIPKNTSRLCSALRIAAFLLLAFGLLLASESALAQSTPPRPISPEVQIEQLGGKERADFDRVSELLADKQWEEAIDTLRRLMENHGDQLMLLSGEKGQPAGYMRYVRVERVGQMLLAEMKATAPDALAVYRSQVDPLARTWYQQGIERRDEVKLRRVVEEAPVSSYGDDALWRLGEWALERGDYGAARLYWQRISPQLGASQEHIPWLAFPDTNLNLAAARARLALVSILEGSRDRAQAEINQLRRLHPQASGYLAGRSGNFVERLETLLKESNDWPARGASSKWNTFGGNQSRNAEATGQIDVRGPPIWGREHVPLPQLAAPQERFAAGRKRVAESADGLLSYHPLIAGDLVLVNDLESIRAYRLTDGRPAWPDGDGKGVIYGKSPATGFAGNWQRSEQPHVGVPRCTMTLFQNKLLARMGSPVTGYQRFEPLEQEQGYLVALDLKTQKLLFDPIRPDGPQWAFEGTPVCDDRGLYVAMRNTLPGQSRAHLHVACYDMQTGRRRWRKAICGADGLSHGRFNELTHNLLTLAGGKIYFNTNLGAVAALAAEDGAIEWITRYQRAAYPNPNPDQTELTFFRDLNPCIHYRGMIIAAPADCDAILALDAASGRVLWKTEDQLAADVVHLLGVGEGNLIVSGDALYWFDAATGRLAAQFPPHTLHGKRFARSDPAGHGRGLLAGGRVYWPTREKIYVFSQRTSRAGAPGKPIPMQPPIDLIEHRAAGGNLLIAKGILLIATENGLLALNAFGKIRKIPEHP